LQSHMCIYTGEKPYECSECKVRFRHLVNLKTHVRTHTKEKSYACDICQKAFSALTLNVRELSTLELCTLSSIQQSSIYGDRDNSAF
jgi:KRAB domain-containing zinc finger protein